MTMKIRYNCSAIGSIAKNNAFIHFDSTHEEEMIKMRPTKLPGILIGALVLIVSFSLPVIVRSQEPSQQPSQQPAQDDPIRQLNLTPEQRQKIRAITEDNRDERMRINRRLREAQSALEETLDADSPSDAAVEERIQDVAAAQAAQIRMRALTELKIRSVLSPEQLRIWREIRVRQQTLRRQLNNPDARRRDNLPNQRNGIAPLFPNDRRPTRP
jgi:Spy/CpxP family protein refolding chaperone